MPSLTSMGVNISKALSRPRRSHNTLNAPNSDPCENTLSAGPHLPPLDLEEPGEPWLPDGFKWIDGRVFMVNGNPKYMLPADEGEIDRLNTQHFQLRNYKAPITKDLERGIKVLDVGKSVFTFGVYSR
ncbi:hypothetical protein BC938DRAFT_481700 [Jimgerdemannia flammicorona]|uniref:Uncharacterized protein n=1 Tax=Jimgerdemannia flammicorona TaxID=994334 RepID=A0A433QFJ6_9FUNG|nr:hypothetical protein BC938DRAFT_481700 [Jimgerdemannia flammicorona]